MISTEIKTKLSEFCLALRADIPSMDQKVQSPLNYCAEILEESVSILELMEGMGNSEEFLEKFTDYWESKMKEIINAL